MDKDAINIDRYLNNCMNWDERLIFESDMEADPFLNDAVLGYKADPGALLDLPLSNVVSISWWYSLIGFFAVAAVFLSIPNTEIKKTDLVASNHNFVQIFSEAPLSKIELPYSANTDSEFDKIEIENQLSLLAANKVERNVHKTSLVFPKSTSIDLEIELPTLRVKEKILYILDLKVIDAKREIAFSAYPALSDLMDFTPANFSTTQAYKRAEKYEGIFPQAKSPTYLERLQSGLMYFKSADYSQALNIFSALLQEDNQDANAIFYSALSQYQIGNYELATALFLRSENGLSQTFIPESKWYRAMSLMRDGKRSEAMLLLNEIVLDGGHYADRAIDFLELR